MTILCQMYTPKATTEDRILGNYLFFIWLESNNKIKSCILPVIRITFRFLKLSKTESLPNWGFSACVVMQRYTHSYLKIP